MVSTMTTLYVQCSKQYALCKYILSIMTTFVQNTVKDKKKSH